VGDTLLAHRTEKQATKAAAASGAHNQQCCPSGRVDEGGCRRSCYDFGPERDLTSREPDKTVFEYLLRPTYEVLHSADHARDRGSVGRDTWLRKCVHDMEAGPAESGLVQSPVQCLTRLLRAINPDHDALCRLGHCASSVGLLGHL
jgi:hypothetical protein